MAGPPPHSQTLPTPALRPRGRARLALLVGCLVPLLASASSTPDPEFATWLAELETEAIARGLTPQAVEAALAGVEPLPGVIELDRKQPRAPKDFCSYLDRRLTATRIERGRRMLEEHRELLEEIGAAYGVPPRYLVALWGLETNFGDYMGDYPVMASLVTLAHEGRRGDLFRNQVFAALRIVDEGHHPPQGMKGSWAGAIGQVQFMPTTFLEFAVDYDGDGRKDLWTSLPDSLASAAHYLRRSGWRSGESWGREVRLSPALRGDAGARGGRHSLADWQQRGVRRLDGGDLPEADMLASIVLPLRTPDAAAFLVYRNYQTFKAWNNSTFFAISVGTLADELGGRASHRACRS